MVDPVSKEEFKSLEARVGTLEREVEGEKMVTRYILEQVRRNGDDLAAIKTRLDRIEGRQDGAEGRLDRVEGRLDRVEGKLGRVESRLGAVEGKLDGLITNLPKIVGDAVREAFREHGRS